MNVDILIWAFVTWLPGCNKLDPYTVVVKRVYKWYSVSFIMKRMPPQCRGLIYYTLVTTPHPGSPTKKFSGEDDYGTWQYQAGKYCR